MPERKFRGERRERPEKSFSPRYRDSSDSPRPAPRSEHADDSEYLLEGRNALSEAVKSGRSIEKLFVADGADKGSLTPVISRCRESGTVIVKCDRRKLDSMSPTGAHQGVIAFVSPCEYISVSELIDKALASETAPLIVVCDHVEDPHNLGAIIRSAEVSGAHGVIIPRRRGASVTGTVVKASAGAALHLPIAKCANLNAAIRELKERGIWVWGAEGGESRLIYDADFTLPTALVLGSEGDGLSRLTAESCDGLVSIPMAGNVNSLNVSAAAAVLLFEAVRQRVSQK
ncbi:MAG: 23S rRNA (guanosine(2251)-2'-O)-methyltransferase RlmB [Oscillospiraceae bacterium]|nr:23S rRNA (guanosine(2251)-2'-O)-methyltransferase RlmB [Oscillospiraceae bacterium]